MVNATHIRLDATDRSYFAILKKEIHALATSAGFSTHKVGEVDIIVAEMVSNLAKHASGGQVLVKLVEEKEVQGIELISVDNGPGMSNVYKLMEDGISTKKTLGHGLGAMRRLSDQFEIYSQKGWGTIVLSRIFQKPIPAASWKEKAEIKTVILPKPGEEVCGDGFYYKRTGSQVKLFLGDGLGHGPYAAHAVTEAIKAFKVCPEESPLEILKYIHSSVRKTRGLVGTVVIINLKEKKLKSCGIGNIMTRVLGFAVNKNYISYNGIIGLNIPGSLKDQEAQIENGQTIIMCSDGIKSRWDPARYPGILRYDLSILSAALLKDFARNTDDMSVAACKLNV